MKIFEQGAVSLLVAAIALALAGAAEARLIRIDTTLAFCDINESAGASVAIGQYNFIGGVHTTQASCSDPNLFEAFSVNLGGTLYNTLNLNNDGLITFGGAYDGTVTALDDPAFGPAIAPYFTETPFDASSSSFTRISYGGTAFASSPYLSINYVGGNSDAYYQVNILDRSGLTGMMGDFDLELSYSTGDGFSGMLADQGGAQVGFNNGAGQSFLQAGSGVAGAFLGTVDDCIAGTAPATALACLNFGTSDEGGLLFQFRNGVALGLGGGDPKPVPAPPVVTLLLTGLGLLALRRKVAR